MVILEDIFRESLPSINPKTLVLDHLARKSFAKEKVFLIGFGKAAAGMASGVIEYFGDYVAQGIVSVPFGTKKSMEENAGAFSDRSNMWPVHENVKVLEVAENNLPDAAAVDASIKILEFVKNLKPDDKLIVCCSGGGSACLACPADSISLDEKFRIIKKLQSKGATIQELNAVRSLLSKTKGGRLLAATKASVRTFILSDIIGDPVELIASGPTVETTIKDRSFYEGLLRKFDVDFALPEEIFNQKTYPSNTVEVIGNNQVLIKRIEEICAQGKVSDRPIPHFSLGNEISGEARDLAKFYVWIAKALADRSNRSSIPDFSNLQITTPDVSDFFEEIRDIFDENGEVLIIAGGEPTVTLLGNGRGGRNQELALAFEIEAQGKLNVEFLSAGTDGQDGPCDVSGAFCGANDGARDGAIELARSFIEKSDSYNYFKKHAPHRHVRTGLTFTNVMDIHLLYVKSSD